MSFFAHRFISRSALAILCCCGIAGAPARAQLFNGGFEETGASIANWNTFNNVIPNVIAAPVTPRSGSQVLKIFGGYNGAANYSGVFQSRQASPGQVWEARGFFRHNTGDAVSGTNFVLLKIEFYRVLGGTYATSDFISEFQITALNSASPLDTWLDRSLQATAPANTVEARVSVVYTQNNNANGGALIDDVTMRTIAGTPATQWTMVWNDEFNGPTVDGTKWRIEDRHLIKNNELQYYAPDEVYIQNGKLVLRSRQRTYSGYDSNGNWGTWNYTSGLVESPQKFATPYGRIEFRAKLPSTRGIWPAHWMLPASGAWPPEIDVMELLGHEPTKVYMSNHAGVWPAIQSNTTPFTGPNFAADMHTFAVEWSPTRLDFFVDGVPRARHTTNIPREPMYIILNTAVGGQWPGNPDGSTVFPQYHEIDYVRVYVPSDPGSGVAAFTDTTTTGAATDGVRTPGEYFAFANGINSGLSDLIGRNTEMYLDSTATGDLTLAFDSFSAWPNSSYGAVVYVDSTPGGWFSTFDLGDTADRSRRLVSGKGTTGQRSDLYFADGFLADYAIVLEPSAMRVYQLGKPAHTLVGGALLGSATDLAGGTSYAYRLDDGSLGSKWREVKLPLSSIGVAPGGTMRIVATLLNGDTAFRANEFVGAATGNAFDAGNPGANPVVLKPSDFLRFVAVPGCTAACSLPGGGTADLDGDCDVDLTDLSRLLANFGNGGATAAQGDTDGNGTVDLTDLSRILSVFGYSCR